MLKLCISIYLQLQYTCIILQLIVVVFLIVQILSFQANPHQSSRRNNVPISRTTLRRILKEDLVLYPYKIERRNKLRPADLGRRLAFCQWLRGNRRHPITFLIGDEAQFLLNGKVCTQNVRSYAPKGNPA